MKKFITRDREAGNKIEEFATYEEAQAAIAAYEAEDKENGDFTEDFYEIYEEDETIDYTYDIVFNDDNNSNNVGGHRTLEEAISYIETYNGTNHGYFQCYKGGVVSVYCNETGEDVYEETVR